MNKLYIRIITSISIFVTIVLSFWVLSKITNEPIMFYLGIPFSISIFFFFMLLLRPIEISVILKTQGLKYVLYILTALSVLAVLFIPPFDGSMLDWMKITSISWFRLFSSLLLTTFLPGFFLLKILDRRNSFSWTSSLVLSCLLSLFLTFLVGFCTLLTNNNLSLVSFQIVLAINILLASIHYIM